VVFQKIVSMMKPSLFTKSSSLNTKTLRLPYRRSQKSFRFIGFYTGVGLLEEDSRGTKNEVRA
jgi:hypothetical protein